MSEITINTYDDDGCYGVIVETKGQAPILWEREGQHTSREAARNFMSEVLGRSSTIRACMVRLVYIDGHELLLDDMKRMHK